MFKATNTLMTIGVMTLALLNIVQAGLAWGWCPDMTTTSGFDLNQYLGVWYAQLQDKFFFRIPYGFGECVQAGYSRRDDGLITVYNSLINDFTN